jgi:hypothetical protein
MALCVLDRTQDHVLEGREAWPQGTVFEVIARGKRRLRPDQ